jgi:DNA repair protein RadC
MKVIPQAAQIVSESTAKYNVPEFTIGLKTKGAPFSERIKLTSSKDAYKLFKQIFDADQMEWVESFMLLCLNRQYKPIGFYKVSAGGMTGTVVDPKVVFQIALMANACHIMVAHNHPSGNTQPSSADIEMTKRLKSIGQTLDLTLLDHVIVTATDSYYSFSDEGLI